MPKTKNTNKENIETESTTSLFPIEVTYKDLDGNEQTIHMKSEITLAEEYALLNSAVDSVISEDMGFQPMWMEYAFRYQILNYFSDYVLSDDINENHNNIFKTNLFEMVSTKIKHLSGLSSNFYEMVDYKKQCFTNKTKADDLYSEATELVSDLRNIVQEYKSKVTDKDVKNVKKILKNLASINFDGKKITDFIVSKLGFLFSKYQKKDDSNVVVLNPKE